MSELTFRSFEQLGKPPSGCARLYTLSENYDSQRKGYYDGDSLH